MALRRLDSLGYQIGLLSRLFDRRLQEVLREQGVAPGQFAPLVMLFEQDGLTQAELCRRINVEQPTMANTLERMERDGLIKRKVDDADRRRALVFLTQKAKEYARTFSKAYAKSRAAPSRRSRPPTRTLFSGSWAVWWRTCAPRRN